MIVNFVCKNLDPLALKVPVLLKSTLRTIKCKHIRLSNRQAELFHGWWLNDYVQFQICWALCLTWIFKQMWLIIHVLLGLLKNQWIIGCPSTDQSGSSTCRKVLLMQFERPPVRSVGSTAWWIWLLAAMMIQLHLSKHGDLFNIFRINFWFFPRYLFLKKNNNQFKYYLLSFPGQPMVVAFNQTVRNADAAKHDRIVGYKHQAVKVIMDLPELARNTILSTVSLYGWDGHLACSCATFGELMVVVKVLFMCNIWWIDGCSKSFT